MPHVPPPDDGRCIIRARHCNNCRHCLVGRDVYEYDMVEARRILAGETDETLVTVAYCAKAHGRPRLRVGVLTRRDNPRGFRPEGSCEDFDSMGEPCEL